MGGQTCGQGHSKPQSLHFQASAWRSLPRKPFRGHPSHESQFPGQMPDKSQWVPTASWRDGGEPLPPGPLGFTVLSCSMGPSHNKYAARPPERVNWAHHPWTVQDRPDLGETPPDGAYHGQRAWA